jgi:hypothetical protein
LLPERAQAVPFARFGASRVRKGWQVKRVARLILRRYAVCVAVLLWCIGVGSVREAVAASRHRGDRCWLRFLHCLDGELDSHPESQEHREAEFTVDEE